MSFIEDDLITEEYKINLGPQHPSTHGVFRAVLTLNGEHIVKCENNIGYLHRGIEKLMESRTYPQITPFTARLDYLAGALNTWGYVITVEKLMQIEVPERAEFIRVIIGELQRMASHLIMLSSTAIDLNGVTGWMYGFTAREEILDLIEMVTGSRMTSNYFVIGGVAQDLPQEFYSEVKKKFVSIRKRIKDMSDLIMGNEIFRGRTVGVGVISAEKAEEYCLTGPNIRTAGIPYDLRKVAPYSVYDKLEFKVPLLKNGDCYDRFNIRLMEIEESMYMIEQSLSLMGEGPVTAKVPRIIKPPVGEAYNQIESAKGILGFFIVSDGSTRPYRLHVHSPSFVNIGIIPELAEGLNIQDFVATFASFDICVGEIDR